MKIINIRIITLTFLIFKNNFSMDKPAYSREFYRYYIEHNNLSTEKTCDAIIMATQKAYMMGLNGELFLPREIIQHCDNNKYTINEESINSYLNKTNNTPKNILEVLEDAYDLGEAYRKKHLIPQYENSHKNTYIRHQADLVKRIRSNNNNSIPAQPIIGFPYASAAAQSSNSIILTNSNNTDNQSSSIE